MDAMTKASPPGRPLPRRSHFAAAQALMPVTVFSIGCFFGTEK